MRADVNFESLQWVIISLLMSADICVFISGQLNLHDACWSLVSSSSSLIKSHGLTGALAAAFTDTALDMMHSGSFLWHRHCSEALPGSLRHPCFCRMRVHTWSRIFSRCADLGTRGLQRLQREVRKRFKQEEKISGTNYPGYVSPYLVLIHACFQTHFLPRRHESEHLSCLSVTQ